MLLTEKYSKDILGVLSCYDRVIIKGTAGSFGYAGGITTFFYVNKLKIFDFAKIFTPVTENIKVNAEKIASENSIKIEYIRKSGSFRKDDKIDEIIKTKDLKEGLVHIFSALEMSDTYAPWHDKETGKTFFKNDKVKCLHYYFYFIDKEYGLCFFKVPTVAPYKVQFYMNGHNWLEYKLSKENIEYKKIDNAFVEISDFKRAQELSDKPRIEDFHNALDMFAKRYCPIPTEWNIGFNFTIHQVEYALDIIFKEEASLKPLYENIIKTAMHTVTPEDIASFLGKRFSILFEGESGSRYNKRILGTRIKHQMGEISVKIYDKFGKVLRIEVTSNDVSQLKTFRDVRKKDGSIVKENAPVKKSIYSLFFLINIFKGATNRYLEYISSFNDPTDGFKKIEKITQSVDENNRNYKGFNFFDKGDEKILLTIADGKFTLKGMTNKELRKMLPELKSSKISRILKRLRLHGIIKKVGKTYKYYLSSLGKQIIVAGLSFKNITLISDLAKA